MAKKKKNVKVVPRRGPPTNVRIAGAHEDKKRRKVDAQEQRERDELLTLGPWALDED